MSAGVSDCPGCFDTADMRLGVVGSRTFEDYELLCQIIDFMAPAEIVSGGARGADSLAKRYALEHRCDYVEFPADWQTYGRRAGFLRNRQIVLRADAVVAFWDNKSSGTKHTINLAAAMQKPVTVVTFKTSVGETQLLFD